MSTDRLRLSDQQIKVICGAYWPIVEGRPCVASLDAPVPCDCSGGKCHLGNPLNLKLNAGNLETYLQKNGDNSGK